MTNEQFTGLIRQYEKLVFTVCYQLVRDYHEAQNLAQDTFLSAYRNIDRCPPESYRPWLCRIAANKAKDFLKSAYNQRVVMEGEEILEATLRIDRPMSWPSNRRAPNESKPSSAR